MDKKEYLQLVISDLLSDFLFYDRKECDVLPVGEIENMVEYAEVTVDEIVDWFEIGLRNYFDKQV